MRLAEKLAPQEFGGHVERRDVPRFRGQQKRVDDLMSDGVARTLAEIAVVANVPLATVGTRVRDMRKPQFGSRIVDVTPVHGHPGLNRYQVRRGR